MLGFLLKLRYLSMLVYVIEYFVLLVFIWMLYKFFGFIFEKDDMYLFTGIWSVTNLCIGLNNLKG